MGCRRVHGDHQIEAGHQRGGIGEIPNPGTWIDQVDASRRRQGFSRFLQTDETNAFHRGQRRQEVESSQGAVAIVLEAGVALPGEAHEGSLRGEPGAPRPTAGNGSLDNLAGAHDVAIGSCLHMRSVVCLPYGGPAAWVYASGLTTVTTIVFGLRYLFATAWISSRVTASYLTSSESVLVYPNPQSSSSAVVMA